MKKYLTAAAMLLTTYAYTQNLKLVLEKGKKFKVTTVTKINSVSEIMGQFKENNTDKTSVQKVEINDASNGETDISITTVKFKVTLIAGDQEVKYDSEKTDNSGMMVETFGKDIGTIRKLTVDATGNLIKKENSVQVSSATTDLMVGVLPADDIPILQPALAGKKFTVNFTWYDSVVIDFKKMKITTTGSYTIKSIESNIASILFSGIQKSIGVVEQMGQEVNINSSNKIVSEIQVDISTGIVMEKSTNIDGNMDIDAAGMLVPVKFNSTSVFKTKVL